MSNQRHQTLLPMEMTPVPFGLSQYHAILVQLQTQQRTDGLLETLHCAIKEMTFLKQENQFLQANVRLLETQKTKMKNQYEEELKKKDELLRREVKKRQARTRAHIDCLDQITRQGIELEKSSEQEKAKCDALRQDLAQREDGWKNKVEQMEQERLQEKEQWLNREVENKSKESLAQDKITSLISENKQLQELTCNHQSLENKVHLLETQKTKMKNQYEEELKKKDELLRREVKKRQARTRAHIDCLDQITRQGMELEKSSEEKAKSEALRQDLAQREDGWKNKVEQMEQERLQEKEQWLKSEEENKKKESLAQDKITFLISKNKQLQELTSMRRRVYPEENRSRYIQAERPQQKQAVNRLQQQRPENHVTHGPAQRANGKVEEKRSDGRQVAEQKNPRNKRQPERRDHGFSSCHRAYSTRPSS